MPKCLGFNIIHARVLGQTVPNKKISQYIYLLVFYIFVWIVWLVLHSPNLNSLVGATQS